MVVSHNNLLTLIGQDSVASSRGSTVRQVLSTFSRSLPIGVSVSTLGSFAPTRNRSASSATITQITLSLGRCIALSHSWGLSLAERALTSLDGRSDSVLLQGLNSIEHAPSGIRCSQAWAWVTLGWGTSIAVSLAANALRRADAIRRCRSVAGGSTLWWAHRAQWLFERWEALRGFSATAVRQFRWSVAFSGMIGGGGMLRDAAFGLWSRSCVGPCDGGFIRILRVGNCT